MRNHPNFTSYVISECGKVSRNGRELSPQTDKKGYLKVWLSQNGVTVKYVHRLVAETYIPNPQNKPQVNHKDGNKSNNHFTNLEWVTGLENAKHATDIGLYNRKLSKEIVLKIRSLEGIKTNGELCKMFNVTSGTITNIIKRKRWTTI